MPKQRDPPSPSKPVPASWWFLTGGTGAPPRTQAGFHHLTLERKAAYRAKVMTKLERKEAEQARKDAVAKVEQTRKDALAELEAEYGPSGLVGRMLWRLRGGVGDNSPKQGDGDGVAANGDGDKSCQRRRQRLGRKELMKKYGPGSGVKAGRTEMAMAKSRSVPKPQADAQAGGNGDQAPVNGTAAVNTTSVDAREDGAGEDGAGENNRGDDAGGENTEATAANDAPVDGVSNENTAG
ncbi:hypothetical protein PG985_015392 [Apiospora marii]|uniref:Uncharacterized protein n=1 Tax=Apiospora marii TaxID=335849 RepID=A0ABR1S5L3_9PEZI